MMEKWIIGKLDQIHNSLIDAQKMFEQMTKKQLPLLAKMIKEKKWDEAEQKLRLLRDAYMSNLKIWSEGIWSPAFINTMNYLKARKQQEAMNVLINNDTDTNQGKTETDEIAGISEGDQWFRA